MLCSFETSEASAPAVLSLINMMFQACGSFNKHFLSTNTVWRVIFVGANFCTNDPFVFYILK